MFVSPSNNRLVYPMPSERDLRKNSAITKTADEVCALHLSQTIAEQDVKMTSLKREVNRLKAELAAQTALLEAEREKNATLANPMLNLLGESKEGNTAYYSKLKRQQKMTE